MLTHRRLRAHGDTPLFMRWQPTEQTGVGSDATQFPGGFPTGPWVWLRDADPTAGAAPGAGTTSDSFMNRLDERWERRQNNW